MKEKILRLNARYTSNIQDLLSELSKFDDATLNQPSKTGGWSAMQNIYHLIYIEEKALVYLKKKMSFGTAFPKTGITDAFRYYLMIAVLTTPLKFKAPPQTSENLPTDATLAETQQRWLASRKNWDNFLLELSPDIADRSVFKHPRAGIIGWTYMLRFFIYHLGRHRHQIQKTINS
jgi:DinB superfamily